MIDLIGKLHPLVIHFPIALVLVAALGSLLGKRAVVLESAVPTLAGLAALGAVVAAMTGWAFAVGESPAGETADVLERHRWSGTVAALIVVAAALAVRRPGAGTRVWLLAAGAAVVVTGHLGGTLVFGADHWSGTRASVAATPVATGTPDAAPVVAAPVVAAPATPPSTLPVNVDAGTPAAATAASAVAFSDIQAVFKRSCLRCHEVRKKKGGLRLDDRAAAMAGGESGVAIIAGDAKRSLLVERINLPLGAKGHMPSKGDPLSADEIALITRWIDEGARWP